MLTFGYKPNIKIMLDARLLLLDILLKMAFMHSCELCNLCTASQCIKGFSQLTVQYLESLALPAWP